MKPSIFVAQSEPEAGCRRPQIRTIPRMGAFAIRQLDTLAACGNFVPGNTMDAKIAY